MTETTTGVRHVISADGTPLALERVTDGPRPMVTLAGGPTGRAGWARVAAGLQGRFAVWLADRRGKGDSGDTEPWSPEREYDDIDALCAFLGPDVVVAAHSSAAVFALGAAARGSSAASLLLYEPPWPLPGRPDDTPTLDAMDALAAAGDLEGSLVLGLTEMVKLPPQAVEGYRRAPEWAEQVANAASWPREGHAIMAMDPGTAALSGVDIPTVMLLGEVSQDFLRASTFAVAEALGDARVVELPGQGHAGLRTAPDLVAETILRELA